jgi:hypothetical protein
MRRLGAILTVLFLLSCSDRSVGGDAGADLQRSDRQRADQQRDQPRPDGATPRPERADDRGLPTLDLPLKAEVTLPKPDLPPKLDYTFPVKDGAVITSPVDILFVIDNSNTMAQEQAKLSAQFPALIDALKLAGSLPDLHIGVVSSDLGAGSYNLPSCETSGGDGGKLQNKPTTTGCVPPTNPWISHANGITNVPAGSPDPAQRVKDAFSCIAKLGTGGCGFENTLEAARRALDPSLNVNPGFLRTNALLAVVFLTDEDDCSAAKTTLYDPSQQGVNDPLGPLSSFRCARFGYTCAQPLDSVGPKTGCVPSGTWLHPISGYLSFFKSLKPAGKAFLAAIAGPSSPISVGPAGNYYEVQPSCQLASTGESAAPALRIHSLLDGLAANGQTGLFNLGITAQNKPTPVSICASDYAPAMRLLGLKLAGAL